MREKLIEVKQALEMCYKQGITSECNGCAYRGHNNVCMDALMEDALAVINQLESNASVQKWIPVTERLPEDDLPKETERKQIRCFVFTDKGSVKTCVRRRYRTKRSGVWGYTAWEWNKTDFAKPTHWMPLPEPPKGE